MGILFLGAVASLRLIGVVGKSKMPAGCWRYNLAPCFSGFTFRIPNSAFRIPLASVFSSLSTRYPLPATRSSLLFKTVRGCERGRSEGRTRPFGCANAAVRGGEHSRSGGRTGLFEGTNADSGLKEVKGLVTA
jgi:hypothetical protein